MTNYYDVLRQTVWDAFKYAELKFSEDDALPPDMETVDGALLRLYGINAKKLERMERIYIDYGDCMLKIIKIKEMTIFILIAQRGEGEIRERKE